MVEAIAAHQTSLTPAVLIHYSPNNNVIRVSSTNYSMLRSTIGHAELIHSSIGPRVPCHAT